MEQKMRRGGHASLESSGMVRGKGTGPRTKLGKLGAKRVKNLGKKQPFFGKISLGG